MNPFESCLALTLIVSLSSACQTTGSAPRAPANHHTPIVHKPEQTTKSDIEERPPSAEAYGAVLASERQRIDANLPAAIESLREAVLADPKSAYLRVQLGTLQIQDGDIDAGLANAERALSLHSGHVEALRLKARAAELLGDHSGAKVALEKALQSAPADRVTSTQLAKLFLEDGEVQKAVIVIETLMQSEPNAIDGYLTLSRLFAGRGQVKRAQAYVDRALVRDPRSIATLELTVRLRQAVGAFASALPFARRLSVELGDTPQTRRLLLTSLLLARKTGEANTLGANWEQEDKGEAMAQLIANAYADAGLNGAALKTLLVYQARAQTLHTVTSPRFQLQVGTLLLSRHKHTQASKILCTPVDKTGNQEWQSYRISLCVRALLASSTSTAMKTAQQTLQAALHIWPDQTRLLESWRSLAHAWPEQIDRQLAIAPVLEAQRQHPDQVALLSNHVQMLEDQGDHEGARGLIDQTLQSEPRAPAVLEVLARFLIRNGQVEEGVSLLEELMERTETDVADLTPSTSAIEHWNVIAFALADANQRLEDAERYAWRAVLQSPLSGYVVDTLGWAQFRQGHFKEAIDTLQRANRLSPDEPEVLFHLASAQRSAKAIEPALKNARRALLLLTAPSPTLPIASAQRSEQSPLLSRIEALVSALERSTKPPDSESPPS